MRDSFAIIFSTQMSVHHAHIVLELEPDRRKDGATVPPKLGKFLPLDAYVAKYLENGARYGVGVNRSQTRNCIWAVDSHCQLSASVTLKGQRSRSSIFSSEVLGNGAR